MTVGMTHGSNTVPANKPTRRKEIDGVGTLTTHPSKQDVHCGDHLEIWIICRSYVVTVRYFRDYRSRVTSTRQREARF